MNDNSNKTVRHSSWQTGHRGSLVGAAKLNDNRIQSGNVFKNIKKGFSEMKLFKAAMLTLVSLFAINGAAFAAAQAGVNYTPITPAQPTSVASGEVEVLEVFSYGCGHCFRFDPVLNRWLKSAPKNVKFTRLPAIFSPTLALYARGYYTAEALGVLEEIHPAFFNAIHVQKKRMASEEEIAALFEEHGVSKDKFEKTFRSFSIDAKVRRATELGKRYGVKATPSMVVNGKYLTDPGMAQGFRGMLSVVDELIAQESK